MKIRFTLPGGCERFAQNPSETFDGAFTVVKPEQAKDFATHEQAHAFLARFGFMRRGRSSTGYILGKMQTPFNQWEIV